MFHSFDNDLDRASASLDRAHELLIRHQRIGARSLGCVAQLCESSRQAGVEHNE